MVISERLQQKLTTFDKTTGKDIVPYKKDIEDYELKKYETIKEVDIAHTSNDPSTLEEYHTLMPKKYANRSMSDEELDCIVYGKDFS